ncbi:MAG TPA: divalent-cation tolerance protein CutA [Acidobacteriota bacterium]|nr:divalent-cation tolerance protein CutA [Acidobacteriota bacterium]
MTPLRIVFSTIDSEEKAKTLARQLVQEDLAACVSIMSRLTSVYRWKGEIEEAGEWLMMIKTSADRVPSLFSRLKELHPYEVPEMLSLAVEAAYEPYLEWALRAGK